MSALYWWFYLVGVLGSPLFAIASISCWVGTVFGYWAGKRESRHLVRVMAKWAEKKVESGS